MKPTARVRIFAFLLAGICFLCGCSFPFAPAASTPAPTSASTPEPPTVTPTPTPYVTLNPVYRFYSEFFDDTSAALSAFSSALTASGACDGMLALMDLSAYSVLLTLPRISVGRLSSDDDVTFSDTLFGAAQGSGKLKMRDESVSLFEFSYSDDRSGGDVLAGTLSDMNLTYVLYDVKDTGIPVQDQTEGATAETIKTREPVLFGTICKTDRGWTTYAASKEKAYSLVIGSGVRFGVSSQPSAAIDAPITALAPDTLAVFDGQALTITHPASTSE